MSHGHVTPNPDGSKARCGGPTVCSICALELAALGGTNPHPDDQPDPSDFDPGWYRGDDGTLKRLEDLP